MGKTCTLPTGQSQYQVVGRFVPNEKYGEGHAQCKVYRMKLFAKNKVVARSRFWYFMGRLCRVKKANGQIISISQARHRLRAPACAPSRPPLPAPATLCRRLAPVCLAGGSACAPAPRRPENCAELGADAAVPATAAAAGAAQFSERRSRARVGRRAAPSAPRRAPLLTASPPPPSPQIYEKSPERVKNFGVWFRYDSRTGTHNAYKEFREMSAEKAINHLYQNMAGLSRAKAAAIQILKVSELAPSECKRPDIKQFHKGGIQFPLPHRVRKTEKAYKTTFKASRPNTHY